MGEDRGKTDPRAQSAQGASSRPLGVRFYGADFNSEFAAKFAGEKAMSEFLSHRRRGKQFLAAAATNDEPLLNQSFLRRSGSYCQKYDAVPRSADEISEKEEAR